MNSTPENPEPEISEPSKRLSGKFVLLGIVLVTALAVPFLLTGKVLEKQVCLRTLQTRAAEYWMIGTYPVGGKNWIVSDDYPQTIRVSSTLLDVLGDWPESSPSERFEELYGQPVEKHLWETYQRDLAFAFVLPIRNDRALISTAHDSYTLRALAVKTLSPADRDVILKMDAYIFEEAPEKVVKRHGYKKSPKDWDYAGQNNADQLYLFVIQNLDINRPGDVLQSDVHQAFRDWAVTDLPTE